jgi:hypothetical protein
VARLRCAEKRAADTAFHQAWSRRSELLACGGTYSRRQRFHSTLHHERSRLWDSAGTGLQNNWPAPSVQRPVAVRETSQVALENRWDCVGASSLEPMPSVDVAPDLRAATIAAMSVRYLFVIAACGGFLLQSAVRRIRVRPPDRHLSGRQALHLLRVPRVPWNAAVGKSGRSRRGQPILCCTANACTNSCYHDLWDTSLPKRVNGRLLARRPRQRTWPTRWRRNSTR